MPYRRLFSALLTLWIAVTITYVALRLLPGDAIEAQLIQSGASPAVIEQRRDEQGLNAPAWLQYTRYIAGLVQGDLGYSLLSGQPVSEMIAARLLPTLTLTVGAVALATVLGLLLGIVLAVGQTRWLLYGCSVLTNLALSVPIYWTGTFAILLFSVQLHWFPSAGSGSLSHLILPVSVLGFHSSGAIARLVKTNLQAVALADFVRTARAKGLPERIVVRRHILRVGLLPTVTVITLQFGFLLSGTVITESLFVRPGIGRLLFERALQQDYAVVQGIVVLAVLVYILLNAFSDWMFRIIDPRVAVS